MASLANRRECFLVECGVQVKHPDWAYFGIAWGVIVLGLWLMSSESAGWWLVLFGLLMMIYSLRPTFGSIPLLSRMRERLGRAAGTVRSPDRWWPPLRRKKQREAGVFRQLVVSSTDVLKAFETLMDTDLQPADNQIDLVSEAWAQMNSAMRTYDTTLVDAPEWLREELRRKIYQPLRKMVDTKADPARFYGEAGVLRDWILEQRRSSPN